MAVEVNSLSAYGFNDANSSTHAGTWAFCDAKMVDWLLYLFECDSFGRSQKGLVA